MPVKQGGGEREYTEIPHDDYLGVCVGWINYGTTINKFGSKVNESVLFFELPDVQQELDDGNKQSMIIRTFEYNTTWGGKTRPSNLRKMLEAWRRKPLTDEELASFDFDRLKFAPAELTVGKAVTADGNEYNKIFAINKWKGDKPDPTKLRSEWRMFDWDLVKTKQQADTLMGDWEDWIQERIRESHEYQAFGGASAPQQAQAPTQGANVPPLDDDDVPF